MKRIKIVDIFREAPLGQTVSVMGWVRTRRGNKNVQFVALNDGSTVRNLQIVFDLNEFNEEQLKAVTTGSAIHVDGVLVESMGKGQSFEVQAKSLEVFCRKKVTHWSFCARKPTCVRARQHSEPFCEYAAPWLSRSTSSSRNVVSSI